MKEIFSFWRVDRVDEGSGLENRRGASFRGFESHTLFHYTLSDMSVGTIG